MTGTDARDRGRIRQTPSVSIAIASYNSTAFLGAAVRSALAQRHVEVEIIIVDDHSSDGSFKLAGALAERHPSVRSFRTAANAGPAGARNLAFAQARGDWIAVLDSDDLIHPDRTRRLLDEAEREAADIVADDLLLFNDDGIGETELFLNARRARAASTIDLAGYLNETRMYGRAPNLGFLKPIFRTAFLRDHDIRYDARLRIAEDDAMIVACLHQGARYRLFPEPLYFYRKHGGSISHRLETDHVDRMKVADTRLVETLREAPAPVRRALARRSGAMTDAWAFTHLIEAVKARNVAAAKRVVTAAPRALALLRLPIAARLKRLYPRRRMLATSPRPASSQAKSIVLISRQRLIGATNGSSAYLLAIARAAREHGYAVHLVQPSPTLFGRTPFFRLAPEMAVFTSHHIRGAVRIGDWLVSKQSTTFAAGARGAIARVAQRAGLGGAIARERKAAYAIATPWTREDRKFVADQAGLRPDVVIADYCFQSEGFAYLLDPNMPSATVMHDLFSARADQFGTDGDSVAGLDRAREIDLLSRGDAVIAIQSDEADFVARELPGTRAIVMPMPADAVAEPTAGDADRLLFIGSNTAPNVIGLRWFLDSVWPLVRAARPSTRLDVAGTVAAAFSDPVDAVVFHGLVDDLSPLYRAAGIVLSPLRQGSGLKIKLIDAIAQGKACVVTGITLQGVEWLADKAVERADDPAMFARKIASLQSDDTRRAALAAAALTAARESFSPASCAQDFTAWLDSVAAPTG